MNRDVTVKFTNEENRILDHRGLKLNQTFPSNCLLAEIKDAVSCMLSTAINVLDINTDNKGFNIIVQSGNLHSLVKYARKSSEEEALNSIIDKVYLLDEQKYPTSFIDLYNDIKVQGISISGGKVYSFDEKGNKLNYSENIEYEEAIKEALLLVNVGEHEFYKIQELECGNRIIAIKELDGNTSVFIRKK